MPNEPLALAVQPPAASCEADYRALYAALSESERGRALLAEFSRRSRSSETAGLLAAVERIEARLQADAAGVERLRDDLRMLLIAIRLIRPEINAAGPAAKTLKLAGLLDLLERRIDAMAEGKPADAAPSHLAIIPPPDEPELPIPSPIGAIVPAFELVHEPEEREPDSRNRFAQASKVARSVIMPEIDFTEAAPPPDPLAAIMALSEDERLALFT